MPDHPLVSIAVINYNNSLYVIETLNSIRDQTYPDIELLIVDDCSTDNSVQLIKEWLHTYNGKYKFIRHEINKGVCAACNSGLKYATGAYYSSIGSDDSMLPEKIAKQVEILQLSTDKVAGVYSDAYLIDESGTLLEGRFIGRHREFSAPPTGNIYEALLMGNFIPAMSVLLKKSVFDEVGIYDESLVYEDYDMWLRIAEKYDIIYSDFISVKYRIRPGSLTFTIKNWDYSNARIFLKHIGAPLPMKWIADTAWHVYLNYDLQTMPLIKELASKINDRVLMTIYSLGRFRIPEKYGHILFISVSDHISRGLSPNIVNPGDSDINIFLNEIVHSMPLRVFKNIALDAFKEHVNATMQLIGGLAKNTGDRYLTTAYLLWKFNISSSIGETVLAKTEESIQAGLPAIISNYSDSDTEVFLNNIIPYFPGDLIKEIITEAYLKNNIDAMPVLDELAKRTKDRYYNAAFLLWKFKISTAIGKTALAQVNESIHAGLPAKIGEYAFSDSGRFLNSVIPAISPYLLEKIALEVYYNDIKDARLLIDELAIKTGNRYLITIHLLWKFRLSFEIGKLILSGVNECINQGLLPAKINDSTIPDNQIFLNEIIPAMASEMRRKIALEVYRDDNKDTQSLIQEFAYTIGDRYVLAIGLLSKFRIPPVIGEMVLAEVSESINAGLPVKINDSSVSDSQIFFNEIIPGISPDLLRNIAWEAYRVNNKDAIFLIQELAYKIGDRVLMTINLLCKFRLSRTIGEKVLAEVNESINAGFPAKINVTGIPESQVFLNEFIPVISPGLFWEIASEAYRDDNKDMISLINELAYKIGNRYVLATDLLWKFNIAPSLCEEVLSKLKDNIINGYPSRINNTNDTEARLFLNEVILVLPMELNKKIAEYAYYENKVRLHPVIKKLAKQTKSRYFKAILALWKFKVNNYTGKIILDRIDGFIKKGRNNFYIDICIYKDIYGAFRTSNSYLFNKNNR